MPKDKNSDLRQPAEALFAEELDALIKAEKHPIPAGWRMSPRSVLTYICGGKCGKLDITPKYIGHQRLVEIAISTLVTDRALLLIGEPGTAKSWLSEHLAAAINGDSTKVVQGTAGTTEEQIRYTWNYAMLIARGPSNESLIKSPIYRAMESGSIARFEEITRCASEVQDALISLMSEKRLSVPELVTEVPAQRGFSIIATANTRDRGVNDMSAALKRRFNFETVHPIQDLQTEVDLVKRETAALLERANIPLRLSDDLTQVLVVTFHELRDAKTMGGKALEPLSTIMSTAEAVAVAYAAGIHAHYFGATEIQPEHLVHNLVGSALKENTDDLKKVRHYFQHVVRGRTQPGWEDFFNAAQNTDELGSSRDS